VLLKQPRPKRLMIFHANFDNSSSSLVEVVQLPQYIPIPHMNMNTFAIFLSAIFEKTKTKKRNIKNLVIKNWRK